MRHVGFGNCAFIPRVVLTIWSARLRNMGCLSAWAKAHYVFVVVALGVAAQITHNSATKHQ